ncbi:translation elongation factor Ts [Marinovum sp. 2_MG-2023]|uniref:translation elongation factor Ts n=1 Tax=Roseobacteraceae TaxID=2854170 RepID=UPI001FD2B838|nr:MULTISPECIES: translation elongation factor Ts [Roseobacteraceae]MCJ7872052.1 translation elongation factor Ts [Phaeobacter sp. J2-8]MDO6731662.1 translation elongation factor Ts [Marinovum sp. 2_MG-2023]MDO6778212.1 translation elongation factor Ts [Marinovum sp. 1_MG-2023]
MAISAKQVKELREMTGAGMMDAKKALTEVDGDIEAAIDWLRTKGLAKAAKKSGRTAAEGLVAVNVEAGKGVAVEVNSETDFVGKNAEFQEMVSGIATAALGVSDVVALAAADLNGKTVADTITDKIAKIGENMSLRRMSSLEGASVVSYVHNAAAPGMGKIGVLVALSGENEAFGKQVAMHIAAANPASLSEADLDPAVVEKERSVQIDIARESGKPEAVIEKMIVGRMKKFMSEVTLLNQAFVIDPDNTVEAAAKAAGVEITGYVRLEVGEGIEKKEEDFAAEVAKAVQG